MGSCYLLGFVALALIATVSSLPTGGGTILVYQSKNGEDVFIKAYPAGYSKCMKTCVDNGQDACDHRCKNPQEVLKGILSNCTQEEYDACVDYCHSVGINSTTCFGDGNCLCVEMYGNDLLKTKMAKQETEEECEDCDAYCDQLPSQEVTCSPPVGCECDSDEAGTMYLLGDDKCTPEEIQECHDRCVDNGFKDGTCLIPGLCSCA